MSLVRALYDYDGSSGGLAFTEDQVFIVENTNPSEAWWQAVN